MFRWKISHFLIPHTEAPVLTQATPPAHHRADSSRNSILAQPKPGWMLDRLRAYRRFPFKESSAFCDLQMFQFSAPPGAPGIQRGERAGRPDPLHYTCSNDFSAAVTPTFGKRDIPSASLQAKLLKHYFIFYLLRPGRHMVPVSAHQKQS